MSSDRKGDRVSYMKVYNGSGPFFNEVSGVITESRVNSWYGTTLHTIKLDRPIEDTRGNKTYEIVVTESDIHTQKTSI